MLTFTWDINITTAFVGLASAVAFYVLVVRLGDRAKTAEERASKALTDIAELREVQAAHASAFALYREQVARDLCSRETIREVETRFTSHIRDVEQRVTGSIDKLGTRIDRLVRVNE